MRDISISCILTNMIFARSNLKTIIGFFYILIGLFLFLVGFVF